MNKSRVKCSLAMCSKLQSRDDERGNGFTEHGQTALLYTEEMTEQLQQSSLYEGGMTRNKICVQSFRSIA